ncbi:MAG: hypothetical protein A2787_03455 [Omnitrophica WOR_2 bacterium RIFCSPHIGHO2_01_FULL_48_9]|nr:MAG: hypothetical protein A2787_03455 [Omnitrophica WOR_2 bacterium RIFCSPHIGHO2_01_FULL_48_9]
MKRYAYLVLFFILTCALGAQAAPQKKTSAAADKKVRLIISLKSADGAAPVESVILTNNFQGTWGEMIVPRLLTNVFIFSKEIPPGQYEFNLQAKTSSGKKWVVAAGKKSEDSIEVNKVMLDDSFITTDGVNGQSNFFIILNEDGTVSSGKK